MYTTESVTKHKHVYFNGDQNHPYSDPILICSALFSSWQWAQTVPIIETARDFPCYLSFYAAFCKEETIEVPAHKRVKPKRKPLPESLERVEVVHDIAESEKVCGCGACLEKIGEETSEKLDSQL